LRFFLRSIATFVEIIKCVQIFDFTRKFFIAFCPDPDQLDIMQDLLGLFGIIPESRVVCFFFKKGKVVFLSIVVKETPSTRCCGQSGL
jgi:hypothetical protein